MSPGAAAPRFRVTSSITGSIRSLRSSPNYKYWVYGAVAIGLWINVTDQSGVNIALPEIAEEFTADIPTVQWITLGYSLATSAMLMPMGRLSDMFGRKLVYLLGFVMFSAMALVGGLSQSLGFLIGVKIMQGLASAGIQANSMALITEVFPDRERGKAMGLYMAIIGTGAVAGPMAGGILISHFGWRSIFFAVLSVAILSMICAALVLKGRTAEQASPRGKGTFDWMGAALSSAALVAFLLAMTNAWKLGWTSAPIAGGLAASLVLAIGFVVWERRASDPMLDMSLFRSRVFSLAIGARFLSFLGGSAVFFLMPFYLIQGLGYEADRAALLIVPGWVCMAVIGPISGRLSDRVGTRWPAAVGMVSSASAMFVLSALGTASPAWHVILGMLLAGFGMAAFSSPNTSVIMSSQSPSKYGIVSAFVNLTRTSANVCGMALAVTLVTITMASYGYEPSLSVVADGSGAGVREAFVVGMSRAFQASGVLMLLALALTVLRADRARTLEPSPQLERAPAAGDGGD